MMEDKLAQRWVGAGVQAGWVPRHYPSSYALVRCLMEYQRYSHCDSVVALGAVTLTVHYKLKGPHICYITNCSYFSDHCSQNGSMKRTPPPTLQPLHHPA